MHKTFAIRWGVGRGMLCALATLALAACGGGGGSSSTPAMNTAFTIGGTVTGLSASGLVLTDNGGDNLAVSSGASTFTFSATVSSGATYSVAVATQPTGETCTVSSGTGTATANVTSVGVACTSNTYTIGGTISGLNESGLVLQDNGGDNLSVPSGAGTFTFSTRLAYGRSYDVTVSSQPATENCLVSSGGSGTVTGNVSTVRVTCSSSSYTVSGTLTGLVSGGLKLQDYSGGETLAVAAGATTFQFTQPLMYGTNVDVQVSTQPFWQTCTPGASNYTGPITSNLTTDTFGCGADTATLTTFAGSTTSGSADGTGTSALFYGVSGVAMDSTGNVYVADTNNNEIRKITPAAVVTTLAGSTTPGSADGSGTTATFDNPTDVAVDSAGNLYVADSFNNEIREIVCTGSTAGTCTVYTIAGSTTPGAANGSGTSARFQDPQGVAVDSAGDVYVADSGNNEIREIVCSAASPPSASNCTVSTLAGSVALSPGSLNGSGTTATFNGPTGLAVDASGNLYVADHNNNEIRKIVCTGTTASTCTVSLLAGSTTAGSADGTGSAAAFNGPTAVAVDSAGDVYVADSGNNEIRLVNPLGTVMTLVGSSAGLNSPDGVAVNASGDLFVGDHLNNEIRLVTP